MKNRISIFKSLIATFIFGFLLIPAAYAGDYDCTVAYPDTDDISPFTYADCIYPQGTDSEPFAGISCRPEGEVLRQAGSNPVICVTEQSILDLADAARAELRVGFNSKTGAISGSCINTHINCGSGCITKPTNDCPTTGITPSLNRVTACQGGCGGCDVGFVACDADDDVIQGGPPYNDGNSLGGYAAAKACVAILDGSNNTDHPYKIEGDSSSGRKNCEEIGRPLENACTGKCADCPLGLTKSGRDSLVCISYGERFLQIFDDGLTSIGGKSLTIGVSPNEIVLPNAYAYGSMGDEVHETDPSEPGYYGAIFVEVDQADHLNWRSASIPAPIASLIAQNDIRFCDADGQCADTSQVCSSGVCSTPGAEVDSACVSSSDCRLGLLCDNETAKCIDPQNQDDELQVCEINDECTGTGESCVVGFCRVQANGIGAYCGPGPGDDSLCAAGLGCNDELKCILNNTTPPPLALVGITNTKFTGILDGYEGANVVCDSEFVGSHVCTSSEILSLYNRSDETIIDRTGSGIITSGPPGYTANSNDCRGFRFKSLAGNEKIYFSWWDFTSGYGTLSECGNNDLGFACCR